MFLELSFKLVEGAAITAVLHVGGHIAQRRVDGILVATVQILLGEAAAERHHRGRTHRNTVQYLASGRRGTPPQAVGIGHPPTNEQLIVARSHVHEVAGAASAVVKVGQKQVETHVGIDFSNHKHGEMAIGIAVNKDGNAVCRVWRVDAKGMVSSARSREPHVLPAAIAS